MNRSSRAFGLNLEERLDVCGFVDVVDPNGRWGLILDEWMMNDSAFFKGRRGLILNWWMIVDPKGRWGLILDERMNEEHFLQGPSGLDLEGGFDEETKKGFRDPSGFA
ncbi:hypothetical protein EV2_005719 [Malus domestica]